MRMPCLPLFHEQIGEMHMDRTEQLYAALLSGKIVEFQYLGIDYLIQQENNKGWDYISIWQIGGGTVCLGRALFDMFDGIAPETIDELIGLPCVDGHSLRELLPMLAFNNL